MIEIIRDDHTAKFLLDHSAAGTEFFPPFAGFVVMRDRKPAGAYILNGFNGSNVDFSGTLFAPCGIDAARAVIRQCFGELGCRRITARTRPSNVAAIRLLRACGFVWESVAIDHFKDSDADVYALLKTTQKLVRL